MDAKVYMMDTGRFHWELPEKSRDMEQRILGLSKRRQEKIRAFRFEKGRHLSLGAGLLLDYGLQAYGLRENDVRIEQGPYGKPYLPDFPDIHFNLSHSGTMVMAAFADAAVGCDVEQMVRSNENVARRFFTGPEKQALSACRQEAERTRLFYKIWTRKESYMKLTGMGMHLAPDSFSVLADTPSGLSGVEPPIPCIYREFPVPGYQAALCAAREDGAEAFFCSFQILHDVV